MKYEWKRAEKLVYNPSTTPILVEVTKALYIAIKGKGDPNQEDFTKRVGVLYNLSYMVKMLPKKGYVINDYFDYTVYPLEGLWSLTEIGINKETLDKKELLYTIMIKQPNFINEDIFKEALAIVKKKKPNPLLDEAFLTKIDEGLVVEMLHLGSYDDEPQSFDLMKIFINENNLQIKSMIHREIYLSDSRKVTKDKYRTILRYQVEKIN